MVTVPKFKVLRRTSDRLRLSDPRFGPRRIAPPGGDDNGFRDDGSAGVREPRRPNPRPPVLSAAATPPAPAQVLDLVAH